MPLLKSKSKKAFEHNIKAEMHAGKPQDQALAIAYSMKRKAPKKLAIGGPVHSEKDTAHAMHDGSKIEAVTPVSIHDNKMSAKQKRDMAIAKAHEEYNLAAGGEVLSEQSRDDEHALNDGSVMPEYKSHEESVMSEQEKIDSDIIARRKKSMDFSTDEAGYDKDGHKGSGIKSDNSYAHGGSIAEAIMNKKRYADGGMVDIESNNEEQPNGYYKRNEHDALNESFDKTMDGVEQHEDSNLINPGDELLEESDEHDMISKIMAKKKSKK